MTTMFGGNLEQLDQLQQTFTAQAAVVADLQRTIDGLVRGVAWTGRAADAFRDQWSGQFMPSLSRLHDALQEHATVVRQRREAIFTATH